MCQNRFTWDRNTPTTILPRLGYWHSMLLRNQTQYTTESSLQPLIMSVCQADPKAKSMWNSSQVPAVKYFKPGGTAIITYNHLASKVKTVRSDSIGQWCYEIINSKSDIELLVVSIYQSCNHHGTDDGMTFHTQQRLLLSQMDRPNLDP